MTTTDLDGGNSTGRPRRDRGAVAAELVIAVPALLLMVTAIVQFAVYAHARHIAQAVAAQALTAARVQGANATAGEVAAKDLLAQLGPSLTDTAVDVQRSNDRVTVTVTGSVTAVLPGLVLPITVRDDGPVERVVPVPALSTRTG